jgi:beta-glucosidase
MGIIVLLCLLIITGCEQSSKDVPPQYTITFDSSGGLAVSPIRAGEGKTITPPEAYKTRSKFLGWFTEEGGTGSPFTVETAITADITVYAKWEADALPSLSVSPDNAALTPVGKTDDAGFWMPRHQAVLKKLQTAKDFDLVFIGDSLIQYWSDDKTWKALEKAHNIINLGFGGDQTMQVIWRLENGEFPDDMVARYAVVLIGTNNSIMSSHTAEPIAAGIAKIIGLINERSPATKILLIPLLPRGPTWGGGGIINDEVNEIIKDFDGHLNVVYLDIAALFKNEDGSQKTRLFQDDKLHLSSAGYTLLDGYIARILKEE